MNEKINNQTIETKNLKLTDYVGKRGSENIAKLVGKRIKGYRIRHGITQMDLAKKFGIAKSTISGYERGDVVPPLDFVIAICAGLGYSLNQFFELEESEFQNSLEQEVLLDIFTNADPEVRKYIIEAARGIAKVGKTNFDEKE